MTLFQRPDKSQKARIAQVFFDTSASCLEDALKDYFEYYEDELRLLRVGTSRVTWQAGHLVAKSHDDILELVKILRAEDSLTKRECVQRINTQFGDADVDCIARSMDLALRLWLLVNVRDLQFRSLRPLDTSVQWRDDESLASFMRSLFPTSRCQMTSANSRVDVHFSAVSLVDICGVDIHWTSNLNDHLLLDRSRRILSVFPYRYILEAGLRAGSPVPPTVLRETMQSLDLLFPPWDGRTEQFLLKEGSKIHEYGTYSTSRKLNLLDFDHWRDRIIEVYEEVYKAPPVTWKQLWRDRRNPQLFYTFWIALAILGLTIAQFVTGVIQAWASLQALKSRD